MYACIHVDSYLVFHAHVPVIDVVVVLEATDHHVARGELDFALEPAEGVRAGDPIHALCVCARREKKRNRVASEGRDGCIVSIITTNHCYER